MIVFCHVFVFSFGLEIDGRLMSASEDEDSGGSVTSYAQVSTQQISFTNYDLPPADSF